MATTDGVLTEDMLTCSLCLELFTEPKSLPCLHTFCKACLHSYTRGRPWPCSMPCPVCRVDAAYTSVDSLPNNFFMKDMVTRWKEQHKSESEQRGEAAPPRQGKLGVCHACERAAALDYFCKECAMWLCGGCTKAHQKLAVTAGHMLVSSREFSDGCKAKVRTIRAGLAEVDGHIKDFEKAKDRIVKEVSDLKIDIKSRADLHRQLIDAEMADMCEQVDTFYADSTATINQELDTAYGVKLNLERILPQCEGVEKIDGPTAMGLLYQIEDLPTVTTVLASQFQTSSLRFSCNNAKVENVKIGTLEEVMTFTLTIKALDKTRITLDVRPSDTVRHVKHLAQEVTADNCGQHNLMFGRQLLHDEKTLRDCNILSNTTLEFAAKTRSDFPSIESYKTYMRATLKPGDRVRCLAGCSLVSVGDTGMMQMLTGLDARVRWDNAGCVNVGCWRLEIC